MPSDEVSEVSIEQSETSTDQPEESLVGRQMVTSTEVVSEQDVESDRGSQSGDSSDSEIASNNSTCLKVVVAAALAGISYYFGPSTITKARLGSLENNAHDFLKGYRRPPSAVSIPDP
jgi:hypothetical protein